MPVYPGAVWRPISSGTDGPMAAYDGAVLHVNESDGNLFNWFNGGTHNVSAHFEVYKTGVIEQYIDTKDDSWCQSDGNEAYISIETEGYTYEALNTAQIAAIAKLYTWLHTTHGIPYQLAEQPGQRGFGWHGMGGNAWGGHPGCPGTLRKNQRAAILQLAQGHTSPPSEQENDMQPFIIQETDGSKDRWFVYPDGCPQNFGNQTQKGKPYGNEAFLAAVYGIAFTATKHLPSSLTKNLANEWKKSH